MAEIKFSLRLHTMNFSLNIVISDKFILRLWSIYLTLTRLVFGLKQKSEIDFVLSERKRPVNCCLCQYMLDALAIGAVALSA